MGIGQTAARGASITLIAQLIRLVLQLGSVVILARLLKVEEFGYVAMVMALAGVADIFRDFGLSTAAIQAREFNHQHRSNLWWVNAGTGLALGLAIFFCAPLIAAFFKQPVLEPVSMALAWTFTINGMATQYRASLNRDLRFKALAVNDIIAQVAAFVVGITMAATGWGVWALVGQQLALPLASLVGLVFVARWVPRLPRREAGTAKLLTFGGDMVIVQLVQYVGMNVDRILIGRYLGPDASGAYDRASRLVSQPMAQIRPALTTVCLPVLAKLRDNPQRYGNFLAAAQVGIGYSLVPLAAVMIAAAHPLVNLALNIPGDTTALVLQALAVAAAANALSYVAYWVFVSQSLSKPLLRWTVGTSVLRGLACFTGLPWGVAGVAWAAAIVPVIAAPLSLVWLSRLLKQRDMLPIPLRQLLTGTVRMSSVATAAGAAGLLAERWSHALGWSAGVGLVVACLGCAAVYGLAFALPWYRHDLRAGRAFIGAVRKRR